MLRQLLLASVAGLALMSPVALPASVEAHCCKCYEVVFRECCTAQWRCYGSYRLRCRANRVVCDLRAHGMEAYIR